MANLPTRNNNPGDLRDPSTGSFKQFGDPKQGYAALLNDLHSKQTGNTSTGLGPTSTLADFAKTYAPSSDNNNSAKYAADLANQIGVAPNVQLKDLDLGKWANAVAKNEGYQGAAVASSQAPQTNSLIPPVPTASQGNDLTAQASTGNAAPESTFNKALDVGKTVGNFLFPIAGDVYHDIKGDNTKTGLQQAGDAGLSVLPLIPGLGEAGEVARGAELTGEGVAKAAPGLLSKLARNTVAKNAAVGYGAGVSQNLSQGKGVGESLGPNLNTIGGGLLGAGGAIAGKALGGILDAATGIPKNRVPVLSGIAPELYDQYAKVGAARAADESNPTLLDHGIGVVKNAVDTIKQKLKTTQGEIGNAVTNEGSNPVKDVTPVLQSFQDNLEKYFGKTATVDKDGTVSIDSLPGRVKETLDPSDEGRIKSALSQILDLNKGGNVQKTSDVIDNLDADINYGKKKYFGASDPLNSFLKQARGGLNDVLKKSSTALGEAKEKASGLHDVLGEVESAGGTNLQRAGLLLKRVLSGDQGEVPRNVFDAIKNETGVDLRQHATLIRHFVDAIGDPSEKSAFQRALQEAVTGSGGGNTLFGTGLGVAKSILNKTIANPVSQGRRIVTGKTGIVNSLARNGKGVITKSALEAGRSLSNVLGS